MTDYPAAHSMDTTWFAIDRDGQVTYASTGETGELPEDACQEAWVTVYLALLVARIAVERDARPLEPIERTLLAAIADDEHAASVYADWCEQHGRKRTGWRTDVRAIYRIEAGYRPVARVALPPLWSGVLVFATDEDVDAFIARYPIFDDAWRETHAQLGLAHAMTVFDIDSDVFADAWRAGAVAAFAVETIPEPRDVGFYEYDHSFYDRLYNRTQTPALPITSDALPAPIRERIATLELSVQFALDASFSPRRMTGCRYWSDDPDY